MEEKREGGRKEDERGANNNNNVTKPQNPTLQSAQVSVKDFYFKVKTQE